MNYFVGTLLLKGKRGVSSMMNSTDPQKKKHNESASSLILQVDHVIVACPP